MSEMNWLNAARKETTKKMDVHFMTELSEKRLDAFMQEDVRTITIHVEAGTESDLKKYIDYIHKHGKKAGKRSFHISSGNDGSHETFRSIQRKK